MKIYFFRSDEGKTADPISEEHLRNLSIIMGKIPSEIIELWEKTNNCIFSDLNSLAISENQNTDMLQSFFCEGFACFYVLPLFGNGDDDPVRLIHTRNASGHPLQLFTLIVDSGGNYIAAEICDGTVEGVYFYDHETDEALYAFSSIKDLFRSLRPESSLTEEEIRDSLSSGFVVDIY